MYLVKVIKGYGWYTLNGKYYLYYNNKKKLFDIETKQPILWDKNV